MAELDPTRLMSDPVTPYDAKRGRRFALTLAAAFGVIALITVWRDSGTVAKVTGGLSALLIVAGALVPSRLGPLETAWMKLAHAISRVTTPIFMGVVYFVVLTPAGFIRRTFGSNPIVHEPDSGSYWATRERREPAAARRRMERQF